MMQKWEYKAVSVLGECGSIGGCESLSVDAPLNELGADGWELVSVIQHGMVAHKKIRNDLVLKRPKQAIQSQGSPKGK
jgi:hypothetical protein